MPLWKKGSNPGQPRGTLPLAWLCKNCGRNTRRHCQGYGRCHWRTCDCGAGLWFKWDKELVEWIPTYVPTFRPKHPK